MTLCFAVLASEYLTVSAKTPRFIFTLVELKAINCDWDFCANSHISTNMLSSEEILERAAHDGSVDM